MSEYNSAVREIESYIDKNKDKEFFDYEDNAAMYVNCGTVARFREQQFKEIYTRVKFLMHQKYSPNLIKQDLMMQNGQMQYILMHQAVFYHQKKLFP